MTGIRVHFIFNINDFNFPSKLPYFLFIITVPFLKMTNLELEKLCSVSTLLYIMCTLRGKKPGEQMRRKEGLWFVVAITKAREGKG